MAKVTFEIADEFTISRRDGSGITVKTGDLPKPILAELLGYGITQKIADSASGAKKAAEEDESGASQADHANAMMEACLKQLVEGVWASRAGGTGVDDFTRVARMVVRPVYKSKLDKEATKAFTELTAAEQNEILDAVYAKNEDVFKPVVEQEIERRKEEAKAKTALAQGIDLDV